VGRRRIITKVSYNKTRNEGEKKIYCKCLQIRFSKHGSKPQVSIKTGREIVGPLRNNQLSKEDHAP
jgi:hypothetical protein